MRIYFKTSNIWTDGFINFSTPKFAIAKTHNPYMAAVVGWAIARKNGWTLTEINFIDPNHADFIFIYKRNEIAKCSIEIFIP